MDDAQVEAGSLSAGPRASRRRLWPLAALLPAALVGLGLALHKAPPPGSLRQSLNDFRGGGVVYISQSPHMGEMMILRNDLRRSIARRKPYPLSPVQNRLLLDSLNTPANDLLQSEALDVLGLAERANALSPAQSRKAVAASLAVLSQTPPFRVRLEGARFLAHSGDMQGIPALQQLLHDPEPSVREAATHALAGFDHANLPPARP